MIIDAAGHITAPHQSAFFVQKNNRQNNLSTSAQSASHVTITWETEIFDQNADFTSNTFTAPVAGRYQFNMYLRLEAIDTATSYIQMFIVTTNRSYEIEIIDPNFSADLTYYKVKGSVLADMDAGDTAYTTYFQAGGAQQTDTSYAMDSHFSGYLVC